MDRPLSAELLQHSLLRITRSGGHPLREAEGTPCVKQGGVQGGAEPAAGQKIGAGRVLGSTVPTVFLPLQVCMMQGAKES